MVLSIAPTAEPEQEQQQFQEHPEKIVAARLDETRQYDQVIAAGGICWTQDGKLFNRVGREVDRDGKLIDPDDAKHVFDTPVGEEKSVVVDERGLVSLDKLSDTHLKVLVESYGDVYVNREDALAYLADMLDGHAA